jgi:hypothetical protein
MSGSAADDTTMARRPTARRDGIMTGTRRQQASGFEGQNVSVSLADGSRIDDATLVSAGRSNVRTLWLYSNGTDVFVPFAEIIDLWQPAHRSRAA